MKQNYKFRVDGAGFQNIKLVAWFWGFTMPRYENTVSQRVRVLNTAGQFMSRPISELLPVERIVVGDRSYVPLRVVTGACQQGFTPGQCWVLESKEVWDDGRE